MFNVVDVMETLTANKCAVVLDSFKYTKIGKSTEQVGNISAYDKIRLAYNIAKAENAVEVQKITDEASKIAYEKSHLEFKWAHNCYTIKSINYNETRSNLSISFMIDGTVSLPSDSPKNLPKDFNTYIYRNFNVIKDGVLNISSFNVILDKNTYDTLVNNGINIIKTNNPDEYTIDLTNLAILRVMGNVKANDMADYSYIVMRNKAFIKVAKAFLDEIQPVDKSSNLINMYGKDSSEYLYYIGINDFGFNPKSKTVSTNNSYKANELLLKFKGMSNLPSYNAFIKKFNDGKKLNNADILLKEAYDACLNNKNSMTESDFIIWLNDRINACEKENKDCARKLFEIRFNVLNCNKWFDEFTNPNDNHFDYNGIDVEFVKQETTVEI